MVFLYGKNICFEICQIPLWMTNHLVITNMIRQTFESKVGKTCVESKEKNVSQNLELTLSMSETNIRYDDFDSTETTSFIWWFK